MLVVVTVVGTAWKREGRGEGQYRRFPHRTMDSLLLLSHLILPSAASHRSGQLVSGTH